MQFSETVQRLTAEAEEKLAPLYKEIDAVSFRNTEKIMDAFRRHRVSDSMFGTSSGYGNNDRGREVLDEIWADVMGAEAAVVRVGIVSGTHALSIGLYGLLRPGDILYTIAGKPYDTLEEVIGLCGETGNGSLRDFGVDYLQTDLNADGSFRAEEIAENLKKHPNIKVVFIQRSKGYLNRKTLSVAEIGGYIAGTKRAVELASYRLTSVGIGTEQGATMGQNKSLYKGLFYAPHTVAQALKTAHLAAYLFEALGYKVEPRWDEPRYDIIQTVVTGSAEGLCAFCRGIQQGSPVDAFVTPEPWQMPGYSDLVVMAAGGFTQGSSIELSADGPLRAPYTAFFQGGLTYESGRFGIMCAAECTLRDREGGKGTAE